VGNVSFLRGANVVSEHSAGIGQSDMYIGVEWIDLNGFLKCRFGLLEIFQFQIELAELGVRRGVVGS
jgi:hypothetical protein